MMAGNFSFLMAETYVPQMKEIGPLSGERMFCAGRMCFVRVGLAESVSSRNLACARLVNVCSIKKDCFTLQKAVFSRML